MLTEDSKKDILDSFLETIKSIADIEYQRKAWIRGEPPGTDFDETVNNYSLNAEGILEHYKDFGVTEIEFQILKKFDKQFRNFYENNNWPQEFINTPKWQHIIDLAKNVLEAFNVKANDLAHRKFMKINGKQIMETFIKILDHLSDKDYQTRIWIKNEGPECQAFDDAVCDFFDIGDPILDDYKSYEITENQYKLLKEFRKKFKDFSKENDFPEEFIETPEWTKIMDQAKEVLKAFNYRKE